MNLEVRIVKALGAHFVEMRSVKALAKSRKARYRTDGED